MMSRHSNISPDNDVTFCCRSLITTLELQHATISVTAFLIGSRFYGLGYLFW